MSWGEAICVLIALWMLVRTLGSGLAGSTNVVFRNTDVYGDRYLGKGDQRTRSLVLDSSCSKCKRMTELTEELAGQLFRPCVADSEYLYPDLLCTSCWEEFGRPTPRYHRPKRRSLRKRHRDYVASVVVAPLASYEPYEPPTTVQQAQPKSPEIANQYPCEKSRTHKEEV